MGCLPRANMSLRAPRGRNSGIYGWVDPLVANHPETLTASRLHMRGHILQVALVAK